MTEAQLYRYFCKEARYYPKAAELPYYAVRSPITRRIVRAEDVAILMNMLRKEAGLPEERP